MNRNRCRPGHTACSSHAGSSFGWRKGKGSYAKSQNRFAWPQQFKTGKRNHGQTVSRKMYATGGGTGTGGGTSKPSPKPAPVEKPGGGSSPKRG